MLAIPYCTCKIWAFVNLQAMKIAARANYVYTFLYIFFQRCSVKAKIFKSGNSQAVRLPKAFRFDVSEVDIFKRGDEVVLKAKPQSLARAFELLTQLPSDAFADVKDQRPPQNREEF